MALYGILKKYIGEWLDLFVILLMGILYYLGLLSMKALYSSMEVLSFFYLYKIYHIIFARQYEGSKKYAFKWDINGGFFKGIINNNRWIVNVINILFIIMPWNLFWYILVNIAVRWKLMKVWFNGNKDIFFLKYFGYDIRPLFEEYIIWYYDNIEVYIRKLVNEPFLRMIIVPTIIRNSVINSSFFSILKARMFMFIFVSILLATGAYEYLHQPWYKWLLIIYIYFLVIWPMIIKILKIEKVIINGNLLAYTTPATIYAGYIVALHTSVNLNLYYKIQLYFEKEEFVKSRYLYKSLFFPSWYNIFLLADIYDSEGFIDHAETDRKFSAIMFWRYEKTYTSFICFKNFLLSDYYRSLVYWCMLLGRFYGRHISKEEAKKMKEFLELYIRTFAFFIGDSAYFINPKLTSEHINEFFFTDHKEEVKGKYEYIVMEFFKKRELLIEKEQIILEYSSTKRYRQMLRCSKFFLSFDELRWKPIGKLIIWFSIYIECLNEAIKTKGYYKVDSKNWYELHEIIIDKQNVKSLLPEEIEILNSLSKEYGKILEEKGDNFVVKMEDLERIVKYK